MVKLSYHININIPIQVIFICLKFINIFLENTKGHMKWLKKNNSPWESVKTHWEATREYRFDTNAFHAELYETIFEKEWPILISDLGPQLVSFEFCLKIF